MISLRRKLNRIPVFVAFSIMLTCCYSAQGADKVSEAVQNPIARSSYVVLVPQSTWKQAAWKEVVGILRSKYDASVIVYEKEIEACLPHLRKLMPRYTCLVAQPEDTGREAVVSLHRILRQLDDDPYTDTIWGIITGYTSGDAKRIAGRSEHFIVRRALGGCGSVNLDSFDEGIKFDEGTAGGRWVKRPGGTTVKEDFPVDSTKGLVDGFNEFKPDLFMTSGHATERDWQIGYNYEDGFFSCMHGQIFGVDTQGNRHEVNSPNSKVYLAVGNCLIGNIPDRNCMATAYMHSAGVDQMIGYTAVTFFGYMGWGSLNYFEFQRPRFTLAESFFAINQSLLHTLGVKYPGKDNIQLEHYDHRRMKELLEKHNFENDDHLGLTWDRDTVAFYGDPAWDVRRQVNDLSWQQNLVISNDKYSLNITANRDGTWNDKPLFHFLPHRVCNVELSSGKEFNPVITDDFILVPLTGEYKKGDSITISFKADRQAIVNTSAEAPVIEVKRKKVIAMPAGIPQEYQTDIAANLELAGDNAAELTKAIGDAPEGQRPAVCFLIANMPERDLKTLTSDFILDNVAGAYKARALTTWASEIPEEIFFNYVLPYANVNEARDPWRADFFNRLGDLVKDTKSAAEAAHLLNQTIFKELNVQYHATKRPKPDQSPTESIDAGYASCTGLSILLIDACRAVGVPARFVGIPKWTHKSGNHSWVEIWDGRWHVAGAAEPDPRGLDYAWFTGDAAQADPAKELNRIYAVSFKKTRTKFPLAWAPEVDYVYAHDVTRKYANPVQTTIDLVIGSTDTPAEGRLQVYWDGELYTQKMFSANDGAATCDLPALEQLELTFMYKDGRKVTRNLLIEPAEKTAVTFDVSAAVSNARRYACKRTERKPVIDGRLNDPCWKKAAWSELFVDIEGKKKPTPLYDTRMKMAWDNEYLFVAAKLTEPHIHGTLEKHDQIVFHDNDFEIFIDPNGDCREYYEIEINALNTIFDLFLIRTYIDGGPALHDWDMRGLQSAVHIEGTLNDSSDTDDYWSVEFALPWRSLAEAAGTSAPPRDGDTWRMNFSRVEWPTKIVDGKYTKPDKAVEDNWVWSCQGVIDMHRPATWGYVTFQNSLD